MHTSDKIYIAGHSGLVGSALIRILRRKGYHNILTRPHTELDLQNQQAVKEFFTREQPDYVFLAAAKVGGILANNTYPADFIHRNLIIQDNIIHQAWKNSVKRLLFLGSSCIYPKECAQPIKEEYLLTGSLEPTNRPYAVAKIAGIETCWAYNRQHNTGYIAAMPTNLYGPGDNYDLENSHVLPALIRKIHQAGVEQKKHVTAWGTGTPRREFLYSDDLADACVFLMNLPSQEYRTLLREDHPPLINIGCGEDQTIKELIHLVRAAIGFAGTIEWDTTRPDGTMQKLLDTTRLNRLGWKPTTPLMEGIQLAYQDFLATHVNQHKLHNIN